MEENKNMQSTEEKETIQTENGASITLDPNLLIDSIEEVNKLVSAHCAILETVEALIKKYTASGVEHDAAAAVALELHRRAAKKARDISEKEEPKKTEE